MTRAAFIQALQINVVGVALIPNGCELYDSCGVNSTFGVGSMAASQHNDRGGSSKQGVVSVTASLETLREHKRLSPLAFPSTPYRHKRSRNNRKKEKERRGRQRHGRRRREAYSETLEDASSSPDVRLKSKSSSTPSAQEHRNTPSS